MEKPGQLRQAERFRTAASWAFPLSLLLVPPPTPNHKPYVVLVDICLIPVCAQRLEFWGN